jgi:hypothetical protein
MLDDYSGVQKSPEIAAGHKITLQKVMNSTSKMDPEIRCAQEF